VLKYGKIEQGVLKYSILGRKNANPFQRPPPILPPAAPPFSASFLLLLCPQLQNAIMLKVKLLRSTQIFEFK
jgi:hypothetical protein